MITVGCADPGDCTSLCDLLAILFTQEAEFTPDSSRQERGLGAILDNPHTGHVLVARRHGRIIAMLTLLYTVSTALGAKVALLEDMVVAEHERGRGVGSQLLEYAIGFAQAQGCKRLTLLTDIDNHLALDFYGKHGFVGSPMRPLRRGL